MNKTVRKGHVKPFLWASVTNIKKLLELNCWRSFHVQMIFGTLILTAPIFSAAIMSYLALAITSSIWVAVIYGLAFGFLVLMIERSVLLSHKRRAIPLRIILVIGVALCYHTGQELLLFRHDISQELYREATPNILASRSDISKNEGLHNANITRLQREGRKLESERRRLASKLNRETNGAIDPSNPYNVSNTRGFGPKARAVKKELDLVSNSIKRNERAIEAEHARYAQAKAEAENEYAIKAPGVEVVESLWGKMTAIARLSEVEDVHRRQAFWTLRYTSIGISVFIEMIVLILKFVLHSNYMKKVKDDSEIGEKILNGRYSDYISILDNLNEPNSTSSEKISQAKTRLKSRVNLFRFMENDFKDDNDDVAA